MSTCQHITIFNIADILSQVYKQQYLEKKELEKQRVERERELLFYQPPDRAFGVPDPEFPSPYPEQPTGIIGKINSFFSTFF